MTAEEPEVRLDVQFGDDLALAMQTAIGVDGGDAIHHEHVGKGKAGIAGAEHFAVTAVQQFLQGVRVFLTHEVSMLCE